MPRPAIRKYPVVIAVEGDIIECPVDRAIFHGDITRCIRNNTETRYANTRVYWLSVVINRGGGGGWGAELECRN